MFIIKFTDRRIIFGDLYDFAGQFRSIPIIKSEEVLGGDTVRYSEPKNIHRELDEASKEIAAVLAISETAESTKKEALFRIVRITAAIWQTHLFREGNTRAIISFSILLAASKGIALDYSLFQKHAAYVRNALVWCCQGIYSKFEYLEKIYFDAAGLLEKANEEFSNLDTKDYTTVNGYYIADYKEKPHKYQEGS
ncbi:MAG: Fic family protein [Anaerovoracaceae bacterium]